MISMTKKITAIVISIITVLFYGYLVNLVLTFREMFKQLDKVELPNSTSLLLSSYYVFILLAIASMVGAYFVYKNNSHGWWYVSISGIFIFFILPFSVWALYLPVVNQ